MDTNKGNAAGMAFNSYILSIDNNILLSLPTLMYYFLYHYLQAYLPKTGVLDAMYDKLFSIYETKNEPLRMSERYYYNNTFICKILDL